MIESCVQYVPTTGKYRYDCLNVSLQKEEKRWKANDFPRDSAGMFNESVLEVSEKWGGVFVGFRRPGRPSRVKNDMIGLAGVQT